MSLEPSENPPQAKKPRAPRICGLCKASGHDQRNNPTRPRESHENGAKHAHGALHHVAREQQTAGRGALSTADVSQINWKHVIYVIVSSLQGLMGLMLLPWNNEKMQSDFRIGRIKLNKIRIPRGIVAII